MLILRLFGILLFVTLVFPGCQQSVKPLAETVEGRGNDQDSLTPYGSGNSGITAFQYGGDWIRVQFKNGVTYEYRSSEIGNHHLNAMKRLADIGKGLNTYISNHPEVRNGWSRKN
jgi:hypothetical protein